MDFQRVLAAVLMSLSIASGISSLSAQGETPRVHLQQAACGALLRDDFNSSTINESLWHLCVEDPGLHVSIDNGELSVRGTSAQIAEEVLRQNEAKLWRFAGVCSRPFPQTDVALATRVKLPSGIPGELGTHAVSVHLCGSRPDTLAEVLFGKLEGKVMEETIHQYAAGGPDDVPYPDARGWWLGVIVDRKAEIFGRYQVTPFPNKEMSATNFMTSW